MDTIETQNDWNTLSGGLKSKLNMALSNFPCNNYIVCSSPSLIIWKFLADGILARLHY